MVRINGLFHLLINGLYYWGYNPLILTIDPNFLGHPSISIETRTTLNSHSLPMDDETNPLGSFEIKKSFQMHRHKRMYII